MTRSTDPVRLVLDTDMGNDIDDALALAMIHALQSRGECKLLGVALSKDNPYSPAYVDVVNTFYGRGEIPIGVVTNGATTDDGPYTRQTVERVDQGTPVYARTQESEQFTSAVEMMRRVLANESDRSVVVVMIGFSTNMARFLESPPDDFSPLSGKELFARKISHVIMMAANFREDVKANPTPENREYNIINDVPSAKHFVDNCPVPIIFSGLEIGKAIMFPGSEIEHKYNWAKHHPVADAYRFYQQMPYDRPSWDLTAVLQAVRPDAGYFGLSESGKVFVEGDGIVGFKPDPNGSHRHMTLRSKQHGRIVQDMVDLVTQPVARSLVEIKTKSTLEVLNKTIKPRVKTGASSAVSPAKLK